MITPASERCLEFLERTQVIEYDTTQRLVELLQRYTDLINNTIHTMPKGTEQQLFVIAYPGKDEVQETAKARAWWDHLQKQGDDAVEAYCTATPYSPYFGTKETFDKEIECGNREELDKEFWCVTFPHPKNRHFYIAKYMPGACNQGFGYRISVHKQPRVYENTIGSIKNGTRVPLT